MSLFPVDPTEMTPEELEQAYKNTIDFWQKQIDTITKSIASIDYDLTGHLDDPREADDLREQRKQCLDSIKYFQGEIDNAPKSGKEWLEKIIQGRKDSTASLFKGRVSKNPTSKRISIKWHKGTFRTFEEFLRFHLDLQAKESPEHLKLIDIIMPSNDPCRHCEAIGVSGNCTKDNGFIVFADTRS